MILGTKFELLHRINCILFEISLVISGFKLRLKEFFILYLAQALSRSLNLKYLVYTFLSARYRKTRSLSQKATAAIILVSIFTALLLASSFLYLLVIKKRKGASLSPQHQYALYYIFQLIRLLTLIVHQLIKDTNFGWFSLGTFPSCRKSVKE